jgi:CBS domain-containing membrane protein
VIQAWLAALRPPPILTDARERTRAALGAGIGLLITGLLCRWGLPWLSPALASSPWLLAPLGASAVLIFAVPAGPLAQPWAVVVGNTVSAAVGAALACAPIDPALAGSAAVALAMGAMMLTRSLHPPGGAIALTAVLTHAASWRFPLFPVLVNSLLLSLAGVIYNRSTGRTYPHPQSSPSPARTAAGAGRADDLSEVLRRYNQVLDVSRDDLEALLLDTERQAYSRRLGELRCEAIMSAPAISVQFGTPLTEAWALLRQHQIKALPVVDAYGHLVGIVTHADFLKQAGLDTPEALGDRLRQFLRPTPGAYASKAEVVGQIMSRQVRVASAQRPLLDLVPLFTEDGHHHIPIVGADRKLVGMVTQSDFLRAWARAVQDGWRQP